MQRSADRILTTHVRALQRPAGLSQAMAEHGEWGPEVLPQLRAAVADVVARQHDIGIDVVDDGEFGVTGSHPRAEAVQREIIDAGFVLQVDDAWVPAVRDRSFSSPEGAALASDRIWNR